MIGGRRKKLSIINAPQVLVIQLARFTNNFQKITTHVSFQTHMTTVHIRDGNEHPIGYTLTGLIVHTGESIEVGHYIAYFLIGEQWFIANDTYIAEVTWECVKALHAYVYFYQIDQSPYMEPMLEG